jgi:hypothetical protein
MAHNLTMAISHAASGIGMTKRCEIATQSARRTAKFQQQSRKTFNSARNT